MSAHGWTAVSGAVDVALEREVAVVRMNRPEKLNALTPDMRRDVASALRHFGDGSRARGVVLTGTGRAFSAGEDLSVALEETRDGVDAVMDLFHDITRAALGTRVPTVAALNGIAVGGASELTLCFDARIGTPDAAWLMPENRLGLTISNACSLLLERLVGPAAATRLVLGGERLDAEAMLALGLLDEVVEASALVDAAVERVLGWTAEPAAAAAHVALMRPDAERVEAAMRRETAAARRVWDSGATRRGIEGFLAARGARDGSAPEGRR